MDEAFSNACFTGDIDRLEEYEGIPRICDYKTGQFLKIERSKGILKTLEAKRFSLRNVSSPYLPEKNLGDEEFEALLESMFKTEEHRNKYDSIMFQMFVYAFLHKQKYKSTSGVYLSVYQLPIIEKCGPVSIRITDEQLEKFSARLAVLLKQIREKAQTPGSNMEVCKKVQGNCEYCYFNKYCRRSYRDEK